MTIFQARKILGKSALQMNNKQIQQILDYFAVLIEVGFQQFEAKNKIKGKDCNGTTRS